MVRKSTTLTAAVAAALISTLAGAEGSGANAQVAIETTEAAMAAAPLTDEIVPAFIEKEVVQELPEEVAEDSSIAAPLAQSLRELVAAMPKGGELSDELHCLAGTIYFESRGEPLDGQLAVAHTVINRAADRRFPSSYCGVVYQRAQFSFVKDGRMPRIKTGSKAWANAQAIARIAHRGLWHNDAKESLYFHANYVRPSWSRRKVALTTINTHIFYR